MQLDFDFKEDVMKTLSANQNSILWAETCLKEKGYHQQSKFMMISSTPWSSIFQAKTSVGLVYLKKVVPRFAIETDVIRYCSKFLPFFLPHVIDNNKDLCCFLMDDAGIPLRLLIMQENYQVQLASEALVIYASIQKSLISQVESLISLGVPDWRLSKLPSLYQDLVNQEHFLSIDGLTSAEINGLQQLTPRVSKLCHQLTLYKIPETIEHGDFHDNNILFKAPILIISDWGEAVITHPFFSLISFFISMQRQHKIKPQSTIHKILCDVYLNCWLSFDTRDRLLEAFELVKRLGPVKYALSFYQITQCPGWKESGKNKGRISDTLKSFLQNEG